jgi:hypothetical protein
MIDFSKQEFHDMFDRAVAEFEGKLIRGEFADGIPHTLNLSFTSGIIFEDNKESPKMEEVTFYYVAYGGLNQIHRSSIELIYRRYDEFLRYLGMRNGRTVVQNLELDKIEVEPGETLEEKLRRYAIGFSCEHEDELRPYDWEFYLNGKAEGIEAGIRCLDTLQVV